MTETLKLSCFLPPQIYRDLVFIFSHKWLYVARKVIITLIRLIFAFNALTLLVWWREGRLAHKTCGSSALVTTSHRWLFADLDAVPVTSSCRWQKVELELDAALASKSNLTSWHRHSVVVDNYLLFQNGDVHMSAALLCKQIAKSDDRYIFLSHILKPLCGV